MLRLILSTILIPHTASSLSRPLLDLGGEYVDPNHFVEGSCSFGGTRMISDQFGDVFTNLITVLGTDDGSEFWTLRGEWIDKSNGELFVDFSPKGGPKALSGIFSVGAKGEGQITWEDGNIWTKESSSVNLCTEKQKSLHPTTIFIGVSSLMLIGYLVSLFIP